MFKCGNFFLKLRVLALVLSLWIKHSSLWGTFVIYEENEDL